MANGKVKISNVPNISDIVSEGDMLDVDLEKWVLTNCTTGKTIDIEPLSEMAIRIISAGGIIGYMRQKLEGENACRV